MDKKKAIEFLTEKKKQLGDKKIDTRKIDKMLEEIYHTLEDTVTTSNIFKRTLKALYNFSEKDIENVYKIYFFDMLIDLIKESSIVQAIPVYDDCSEFYIYEKDKIYKHSSHWYVPFYNQCEEIEKVNCWGGKNSEYDKAIEYRKKFENNEEYLETIW